MKYFTFKFKSLLLILFIFLVSPNMYAEYVAKRTINGIKYSLDNSDYVARVDGYTSAIPANLTIPSKIVIQESSTIDGVYQIIHIDGYAFENCATLQTINIEIEDYKERNGNSFVCSIGAYAFRNCNNLREVNIPNTLYIGQGAFVGCTSLERINNVGRVEEYAFCGCSNLKNITFSDACRYIGQFSFEGCSSLENFELSSNLEQIMHYAFKDCKNLTEIKIPSSLTILHRGSFQNCSSIKRVIIEDGDNILTPANFVTGGPEYAFADCNVEYLYMGREFQSIGLNNSLKTLEVGEKVKKIQSNSFQNYNNLSTVIFSNGLEEIGGGAFQNCTALKTITLPESTKKIDYSVFQGCSSLDIVNSNIPDITKTTIGNYCFDGISANSTLYVPKDQRQYYAKVANFDKFRFIKEKEAVRIDDISKLSNGKVYRIEPEGAFRGILYTSNGSNYLDACGGNSKFNNPNIVISDTNTNQQFAIYNYNGQYYLYSIGQQKFVSRYETSGNNIYFRLDSKPNQSITINPSSVDDEFIFIVGNKEWINVSLGWDYGCVGNWEIEDPGNRMSIIEIGDIPDETSQNIKKALDIFTGIVNTQLSETNVEYFNIQGQRIAQPQRGQLVIVRNIDGTSRKMLVK